MSSLPYADSAARRIRVVLASAWFGLSMVACGGGGSGGGGSTESGESRAATSASSTNIVQTSSSDTTGTTSDDGDTGSGASEFRIFNAMLYANMPSIGTRAPVVYESAFYPNGQQNADETPTDPGIAHAVSDARDQQGAPWFADPALTVIDIERWSVWPFVEGPDHDVSIGRYANAAQRFRASLGTPICLYAIAPEAGIVFANWAITKPEIRAGWTAASDMTQRLLLPHVDALCPQLYAFYGSADPLEEAKQIAEWKGFARETIREARRIGAGKPVYPFVWPQFHTGGSFADYPFVPAHYWRAQLEAIRDEADGLILWGGWNMANNQQMPWDPSAAWVQVLYDVFPETRAQR